MLLLGLVEFIFCYFTSHYNSSKMCACFNVKPIGLPFRSDEVNFSYFSLNKGQTI